MLSVLLFVPTSAAQNAAKHPHNGLLKPYHAAPPDVTLSSDEQHQLKIGEPVYTQINAVGDVRPAVVFRVEAPPAVIWSVITDFASYPKWIEGLAEAEIYRRDGAEIFVRFQIRRWLIGNITYYVHHTYPFPDEAWGTWKLDYSRNSDFDDSVGFWRVLPVPDQLQYSDVTYSAQLKLKGWFAGLINRMLVKDTLRQISTWVKTQSESRAVNDAGKARRGAKAGPLSRAATRQGRSSPAKWVDELTLSNTRNAPEITSLSGLPDRPSSALQQQLHSPAMRLLLRLEYEQSFSAR